MPLPDNETYISVDIETAGPNPGQYAMLSIGACTVTEPVETFYVEIQPDQEAFSPEALQVSGLKYGRTPQEWRSARTSHEAICGLGSRDHPIRSQARFCGLQRALSTGCSSTTISIATWGIIPSGIVH